MIKQAPADDDLSYGLNLRNSVCPNIINPIATCVKILIYIKEDSEEANTLTTIKNTCDISIIYPLEWLK